MGQWLLSEIAAVAEAIAVVAMIPVDVVDLIYVRSHIYNLLLLLLHRRLVRLGRLAVVPGIMALWLVDGRGLTASLLQHG